VKRLKIANLNNKENKSVKIKNEIEMMKNKTVKNLKTKYSNRIIDKTYTKSKKINVQEEKLEK
tara:strand:- start:385 stop:573 length:189 start_codon:yes stop_codon:yes gene_type:complete